MGALQALSGGKKGLHWASKEKSNSQGLGLVLPLTARATLGVPRSTEHCFLWSQVRGAVRDASPITLASITREEGFPLEKHGQGSTAQGGHGCWLPNSGLCQTHRNPSVQRKETGRPSRGSRVPVRQWPEGRSFRNGFWPTGVEACTREPLTSQPQGHQPWGRQRR